MIRNAFFELFIICTLLITGMCQDILPADSSLLYSECSESDSRSLTTVINQLKNQSSLLELSPEHPEQTTGNGTLTHAGFQAASFASLIGCRNASFCNPLWYIFFYFLFCCFPVNITTWFYHPSSPLASIICYIHQQDGQKPANSFL